MNLNRYLLGSSYPSTTSVAPTESSRSLCVPVLCSMLGRGRGGGRSRGRGREAN